MSARQLAVTCALHTLSSQTHGQGRAHGSPVQWGRGSGPHIQATASPDTLQSDRAQRSVITYVGASTRESSWGSEPGGDRQVPGTWECQGLPDPGGRWGAGQRKELPTSDPSPFAVRPHGSLACTTAALGSQLSQASAAATWASPGASARPRVGPRSTLAGLGRPGTLQSTLQAGSQTCGVCAARPLGMPAAPRPPCHAVTTKQPFEHPRRSRDSRVSQTERPGGRGGGRAGRGEARAFPPRELGPSPACRLICGSRRSQELLRVPQVWGS